MKFILFSVIACAFISSGFGEIVATHSCDDSDHANCAIQEVRINPCKEALKTPPQPCKFKKLKTASIEVDFTPDFVTQNMTVQMYWVNGIVDLPLAGMDTNACHTTTCPTVAGVQQTYKYDLKIDSYFPLSTYDVKCAFKGDDDSKKCCFIYKIKITK